MARSIATRITGLRQLSDTLLSLYTVWWNGRSRITIILVSKSIIGPVKRSLFDPKESQDRTESIHSGYQQQYSRKKRTFVTEQHLKTAQTTRTAHRTETTIRLHFVFFSMPSKVHKKPFSFGLVGQRNWPKISLPYHTTLTQKKNSRSRTGCSSVQEGCFGSASPDVAQEYEVAYRHHPRSHPSPRHHHRPHRQVQQRQVKLRDSFVSLNPGLGQ